MALQPSGITVPLFGGLDLKTDAKYVAPDKLLSAQNVRFPAVERCEPRYGQSVLSAYVPSSDTFITAGKALGSSGNELLSYDGSSLYAYSPSINGWVNRGSFTEAQVSIANVSSGVNSAQDVCSAVSGTTELYAWTDSNGSVYYTLRDSVSGTLYANNQLLNPRGSGPVAFAAGSYLYVVVADTITGAIVGYQFATGAGSVSPNFSATLGYGVPGTYHAAQYTSQGTILLAYLAPNSPNALTFSTFTTGLSPLNSKSTSVSNFSAGARIAVASGVINSCYAAVLVQPLLTVQPLISFCNVNMSVTPTQVLMPTASGVPSGYTANLVGIEITTAPSGKQVYCVVAACSASGRKPFLYFASSETSGAPLSVSNPFSGLYLASQVTAANNHFYWIAASNSTTIAGANSQQWSYYLQSQATLALDVASTVSQTLPAPQIIQRYYDSQAYTGAANPVSLAAKTDGSLFAGQAYRGALRADASGTVFTSNYICGTTFTFPTVSNVTIQRFNNVALINCGATYTYDGYSTVEQGFWEFPEGIVATANGTGTGSLNNLGVNPGQYQVFVTYEWADAAGNQHYSAPSYPVYVNTAQNDSISVAFPYTALTRKSGVNVCIYITTVNASSPAYKVGSVPNLTDGTAAGLFTITTSDLTNSGNQRLYAPADFSGELENDPAPPFKYMFATKTRVFGIPQDNPYQLWYSKPMAPGRPAEFSAAQFIVIEQQGGPVTGLAAVDTQAIVFKADRIYTLPGDGPNAAGVPANGFPSTLQLISSTTGCTSNPSILATSDGLFFQSKTGLSQLNRSISVDAAFGMPVQPLVQSLSFTGAQAVPAQNQLRWTSANGTCIVYDYVVGRWSTYTNYDAVGYAPYGTTFARLRSDGTVWYEDTTRYDDNGTGVQILVETAWLKPAQMAQGFAAVWYASVLGDYLGAHTLTLECAYDYLNAPADTVTWNATANGNLGTYGSATPYGLYYFGTNSAQVSYGTRYQVRYAVKRQVCEAVKFKLYATGSSAASCALNEIALQLGVIGGTKRLPSTQQV